MRDVISYAQLVVVNTWESEYEITQKDTNYANIREQRKGEPPPDTQSVTHKIEQKHKKVAYLLAIRYLHTAP